jgi:hypothetical protein
MQSLVQRLRALLADGEAEAADVIEQLLKLSAGTSHAAGVQKVAQAVSVFDFEGALDVLDTISL